MAAVMTFMRQWLEVGERDGGCDVGAAMAASMWRWRRCSQDREAGHSSASLHARSVTRGRLTHDVALGAMAPQILVALSTLLH